MPSTPSLLALFLLLAILTTPLWGPRPTEAQEQQEAVLLPDNRSLLSQQVLRVAKKQAAMKPPPNRGNAVLIKTPKKSKIPLGPGYYEHLQQSRTEWQERTSSR
jgi:hypothetical protein